MQPRLGVAAFLRRWRPLPSIILVWGIVRRIIAAPLLPRPPRRASAARTSASPRCPTASSRCRPATPTGPALLAREARGNLPRNAAAQLLEARADLALGDMHSAREHYRALISNRKTALAALAGLYDQARAQGRTDAALTFAQKAVDIAPQTRWAREAVFDDLTRQRPLGRGAGAWSPTNRP